MTRHLLTGRAFREKGIFRITETERVSILDFSYLVFK